MGGISGFDITISGRAFRLKKYIGNTWNFVFETAPSAVNCMSALITLPKPTFKKNLKWEDRPPISKIPTFQPVWKKMSP